MAGKQARLRVFGLAGMRKAIEWAAADGQALHLEGRWRAPKLWQGVREIGHLLDRDRSRLVATARMFGVSRVRIHGRGDRQHVDLWGLPLEAAIRMAQEEV